VARCGGEGEGGAEDEGGAAVSGLLERILEQKRAEVWKLKSAPSYVRVPSGPRGNVVERLSRPASAPLRLIAEIKRRSPSAGELSSKLPADERALAYARSGADMVSVLTDERFFGGGWHDLFDVRTALERSGSSALVLAKEFVVDERQIAEAAASGADAVLLIARIVDGARLGKLTEAARHMRLEPLVEVVTEAELAQALEASARVIGVNARDLDTLEMDTDRAARVLEAIPSGIVAVHLSGLKTPGDVARVAASRTDAALIGETLMRQDDPRALLSEMTLAAKVSAPSLAR
jgi:indole-3-glycerol phosphate synthase